MNTVIKRGTMEIQGRKYILLFNYSGFLRIAVYCNKISKKEARYGKFRSRSAAQGSKMAVYKYVF